MAISRSEILRWLHTSKPEELAALWAEADHVRRANVGDEVFLRGLIELSNHCVRLCGYCGLRAPNRAVERYRMTADEVLECVHQAVDFGYGTVVLQAGEDPGITGDWMGGLIRRIKGEADVAVTLSLGERNFEELSAWRDAGADRYLLRFETSNPELYAAIHPPRPGGPTDRLALLRQLRTLGYEVGSGVMIGIPGQRYDDLADDIAWFGRLDLDMIGVGPFIAHPATPLGQADAPEANAAPEPAESPEAEQVPNTELMTYKVIALARLMCPRANIPSTTALATLNKAQGRELGLQRGANIVMPNLTPVRYRAMYEIYPAKACIQESAGDCQMCLRHRIERIGRPIGIGRGDSPNAKGDVRCEI